MAEATEKARMDALLQLDLLDTDPSEAFDRITRMAATLFELPIAAVSLTDRDRQWFKSRVGVKHTSIPREGAPCAQVAETAAVLVIPDMFADPCYRNSHLARSGIRFYAGAPLTTQEGYGLGAMCVLGLEPREVTSSELVALKDLSAMVMAQIELQHAFGRVDPLSRMPNRNQFIEDLQDLARDQPEHLTRLAVLVEVASPEQISSSMRVLGSSYVDNLIKDGARAIRSAVGPTLRTYHVGAGQFGFIAPTNAPIESFAAKLADSLSGIQPSSASRFAATAVIGVAPFTVGTAAPRDILRMTYSAAQDARKTGKGLSIYSSTQDTAHQRRFMLLQSFGRALGSTDQLRLVYQPRIDLTSRLCVGAEALLRWRHPSLGEISPAEFMPLVERTELAKPATAWVLNAALKQLAHWRQAGLQLQISINVSATNLLEADLVDRVLGGLAQHSLAPDQLEIEITETGIMEDTKQALANLEALAEAGIRLAIDDFGTGYSSLSYLQSLPAQVVKIDQSFVRGSVEDHRQRALLSAMVSLSHALGYRVVAEGVETATVLDLLVELGCDEAQGYLFGHPMDPDDMKVWLSGGQCRAFLRRADLHGVPLRS